MNYAKTRSRTITAVLDFLIFKTQYGASNRRSYIFKMCLCFVEYSLNTVLDVRKILFVLHKCSLNLDIKKKLNILTFILGIIAWS